MQLNPRIEAHVRDAMGHCLHGNCENVAHIIDRLNVDGDLLEAIRMWAYAATNVLYSAYREGITPAELDRYAQDIIDIQRCPTFTTNDHPALAQLLLELWNCEIPLDSRDFYIQALWLLEVATVFVAGSHHPDVDPDHPDPDSINPWWELLDEIWGIYAEEPDDYIQFTGEPLISG